MPQHRVRRFFRLPFPNARQNRRELRDELAFHIDKRVRELRTSGLKQGEARRRAVAEFGDLEYTERYCEQMNRRRDRRRWRSTVIVELTHDIRFALRQMRAAPLVCFVTVLTLALGIGANSAIFSVANAALLRGPGVLQPESLAAVWTTCRAGAPRCSSSYPDYLDYRERASSFVDLAAYSGARASLGDSRGARLVTVQLSTGNLFELLGVAPARGRLLQPADDVRSSARRVVALDHGFWRSHFAADEGVVGSTIRLNRQSFTIIGVVAPSFRGLELGAPADVYIPIFAGPALSGSSVDDDGRFESRGSRWIGQLVGRLAPGVTAEQAQAEMLTISAQMAEEDPDARGPRSVTVDSAARLLLPVSDGGELRRLVIILVTVVGLILLLACANLANLFLARASARRHEVGVRLALGASRGRLIRQLLTESLTYALLGGLAGQIVALGVVNGLGGFELPGGLALATIGTDLDARVFLFALALSLLTGIAFGLVPALQASRPDVSATLKARGGSEESGRTRNLLVAVQVAVCLVLLLGSALFLQALRNGLGTDVSIALDRLAVASYDLGLLQYEPEEARLLNDRLVQRVASLPNVRGVGLGTRAPLVRGHGTATLLREVEGYELGPDEELRLEYNYVSPGYFDALGLQLLAGRTFAQSDTPDSPPVMVINRTMAEKWWPGRDPVGGIVRSSSREITVIGVVADTRWDDGLRVERYPFGYLSMTQSSAVEASSTLHLVVNTAGDPGALLAQLRAVIGELDDDISISRLSTMYGIMNQELMPQRMGAVVLSAFSVLAVLLATVGIYGVVAYAVTRRRREMGVYLALGAQPTALLAMVTRGMVVPISVGLALGAAVALAFAGALESFMYDLDPTDPATMLGVVLLLAAVALIATVVPARKATRVDPVLILRAE